MTSVEQEIAWRMKTLQANTQTHTHLLSDIPITGERFLSMLSSRTRSRLHEFNDAMLVFCIKIVIEPSSILQTMSAMFPTIRSLKGLSVEMNEKKLIPMFHECLKFCGYKSNVGKVATLLSRCVIENQFNYTNVKKAFEMLVDGH